ncbi:MAG TPA: hypothetical protein VN601_05060 [Arthrobacter sp.]|nr:hypothetical protein [Arthrobacter sp.]
MTTVPTQPYRPPSTAGCDFRPTAFESFLIRSGRALMLAGEHRARRQAALRRSTPSHGAPAVLLLAHETLRADVQAAAHSGIHAR